MSIWTDQCGHCNLDTGGNHEAHCPLNPANIIHTTIEEEIDEYIDTNFPNVVVRVTRPKNWGSGYAIENSIRILRNAYYKFYGKEYKK